MTIKLAFRKITIDCSFILHALITKTLSTKKNSECSIPWLGKMLDKTDRLLLWGKLLNNDVSLKRFISALTSMYGVVKSYVRYCSERSYFLSITNLRFRPLRYYTSCKVYITLRTIKNIQLLIIVRKSDEHHRTLFEN